MSQNVDDSQTYAQRPGHGYTHMAGTYYALAVVMNIFVFLIFLVSPGDADFLSREYMNAINSVRYRIESFGLSKHRAFDLPFRTCFKPSIP